ncbi:MAG: hypothetical protein ACJAZ8_001905 [Planctomycetota bacterium]|jgi:hypothetical protein
MWLSEGQIRAIRLADAIVSAPRSKIILFFRRRFWGRMLACKVSLPFAHSQSSLMIRLWIALALFQ